MKKVFNKLILTAVIATTFLIPGCSKDNFGYNDTPTPMPTAIALVITTSGEACPVEKRINGSFYGRVKNIKDDTTEITEGKIITGFLKVDITN